MMIANEDRTAKISLIKTKLEELDTHTDTMSHEFMTIQLEIMELNVELAKDSYIRAQTSLLEVLQDRTHLQLKLKAASLKTNVS